MRQDIGHRKLRRALRDMLSAAPMLSALAFRLDLVSDANTKDISADGRKLRYNPQWVEDAEYSDVKLALGHVILACGLSHHLRRGDRDYDRWQIASKRATSPLLCSLGYAGETEEITVEAAYELVEETDRPEPGEVSDAPGKGENGGAGDGSDEGNRDGEARQSEMREWATALLQAAQIQDRTSEGAGNLSKLVRDTLTPRVSWREVLREFVTQRSREDATWRRPNRRFVPYDLYLPSQDSERLGSIVVAVDTSGSMTGSKDELLLQRVWTEIRTVIEELRPERVRLIECDTKIQLDEEIAHDLPEELPIVGGGGTHLAPIMEAIRQQEDSLPSCAIVFSDLGNCDYGPDPGIPVLWAAYGREWSEPPFGRIIRVGR